MLIHLDESFNGGYVFDTGVVITYLLLTFFFMTWTFGIGESADRTCLLTAGDSRRGRQPVVWSRGVQGSPPPDTELLAARLAEWAYLRCPMCLQVPPLASLCQPWFWGGPWAASTAKLSAHS